ncbi:DNA gyrase/topoisomerase IV subunit B [Alloscardovia macacae]|uniref:DNA topoisomerase (ATP-hydrolyzing) n=1 Tax=Alloscardovia macacae TaxID=1160091 RepID=A0A261F5D8_9BIFI|nr:DNA topoisomerase IV subunit B [Alloscardovia macacae]OZG54330.1 DNA topoisomerase IV subunit B [Alloscardovia macacae]
MAAKKTAQEDYNADSLSVLEGLDAVRKRPGMYIGTTDSQGLMHCLWEIIDNSVDEALAGACTKITVTLHTDGSITVEDNGRGIPIDKEPKTGLSGVEVVLTKLHAGAKFGNASYNAVGGLHGVGSSVVNALSERLDVEVDRDGQTYRMEFHQGHPGVYTDADASEPSPKSPFKKTPKRRATELRVVGTYDDGHTGTRIRYWLDPEIFNATAVFSYEQLVERVRQTSFLVPGLEIHVVDEKVSDEPEAEMQAVAQPEAELAEVADEPAEELTSEDDTEAAEDEEESTAAEETQRRIAAQNAAQEAKRRQSHPREQVFLHEGGIVDYVDFLSKGEDICDIWHITGQDTYEEETQVVTASGDLEARMIERTCDVDIALRWVNDYETTIRSFVNVVETPGGGMHVDGFLNSITKQVRKNVEASARKYKISAKDSSMKVERDDVTSGLVAVVTVRIAEPQFQGQTKDVLGTAPVKPIVTKMSDAQFGEMISGSKRGFKEQSARVLEKIVGEMHARIQSRKAKEVTRRKNALESASMPSKLSDCQPGNDDIAELFIVEGDSALGTAKAARNSMFQALLPIRGKILNVQKASTAQILANKECSSIIQVVGAGSGSTFDVKQARYNKVVMMTDADVDGAHIRTLLLTLFYRYMRPLIAEGHVYAAVPPLHRIALVGKRKGEYIYTYSEEELGVRLAKLRDQGIAYNEDIQRYKGLGEMDADQLADTTMDPRTRMLRRIRLEDAAEASEIFSLLMGDEVPPRKQFIIDNADDFDRSKIDA